MQKAGHNEQLGIPTLGFVLANVAHTMLYMQPETKHPLYDHFLSDTCVLVFGGRERGVIAETVTTVLVRNEPWQHTPYCSVLRAYVAERERYTYIYIYLRFKDTHEMALHGWSVVSLSRKKWYRHLF